MGKGSLGFISSNSKNKEHTKICGGEERESQTAPWEWIEVGKHRVVLPHFSQKDQRRALLGRNSGPSSTA